MTRPETNAYLAKARQSLVEANVLVANHLADYAIGHQAGVTTAEANEAIGMAACFVDGVALLLGSPLAP